MTLNQVLVFLAGPGAAAVLSFAAERFGPFQKLAPETKRLAMYAGSILLALAAFAVIQFVPAAILDALAPGFAVAYAAAGAVWANQTAHAADRARG